MGLKDWAVCDSEMSGCVVDVLGFRWVLDRPWTLSTLLVPADSEWRLGCTWGGDRKLLGSNDLHIDRWLSPSLRQ